MNWFYRLRRLLLGPNPGQWDEDPVNLQPDKLATKTRFDNCVGCPGLECDGCPIIENDR